MDIDTVKLLASYNEKTNEQMNALISRLEAAQWDHTFATFFPSIRLMCNHLYVSDFNWLRRFSALRDFRYARDSLFSQEIGYGKEAFVTQGDYLSKRKYLDKLITAFANEVTDADLGQSLTYKDLRGNEHTRNFGGLALGCFNHQTHHRGMISVFLEMLGIENDYSSLWNLL